jgi:hypothetical protein
MSNRSYFSPNSVASCAINDVLVNLNVLRFVRLLAIMCFFASAIASNTHAACITEKEFKARVETATRNFKDLTMTGTATYKNKKAMEIVDPNYSKLYEFKSANVSYKDPNKLKMEGKLGMVRFEYIINGSRKIVRSPNMRINKKEDYTFTKENIIKAHLAFITESYNIDNQRIIDEKMDELIGEKIITSSIPFRDNDFIKFLYQINLLSQNPKIFKWLSNINNMIGLASAGDLFFSLSDEQNDEFEKLIEKLEIAFKSISNSKIKLSIFRRKMVNYFIRHYFEVKAMEINDIIDKISVIE